MSALSALPGGGVRWYRITDGTELLALFAHGDRKRWVLWTPAGYYDASAGGDDLIGWHVNRGADMAADFFPAARFRAKFHRPDVIDRVLNTLDEREALRQADAASGRRPDSQPSIARILPPVVDLLTPANVRTSEQKITVRVRARSAADAQVTAVYARINGRALPEERGLARLNAAGEEREIVVSLPPQDAEVQIFAENAHGISTPATVCDLDRAQCGRGSGRVGRDGSPAGRESGRHRRRVRHQAQALRARNRRVSVHELRHPQAGSCRQGRG